MIGDVVQSIGVALAGALIWGFGSSGNKAWYMADPLCTLLFACLVFATTRGLAADVFRILMAGTPIGVDVEEIRKLMLKCPGVEAVSKLHVWEAATGQVQLMAHVSTRVGVDHEAVLT